MKIEMIVSSFLFGLKALVNSTDKMYMLNYWPVLILFGSKIDVLFVSVLWGHRQGSFR